MADTSTGSVNRSRLGPALLIGAVFALTFCFFSVTEVFAANRVELLFNFRDFAPWILLVSLGMMLLAALLIYLPGGKISCVIAAVFVWLTLMGYVQSTFLNGTKNLAGDDREAFELGFPAVLNLLIWIAALVLILLLALKWLRSDETLRTGVVILMVMLLGMQIAGFVSNLPKITLDRFAAAAQEEGSPGGEADENDAMLAASYLCADGMFDAASKSNIYVIVLDRLDIDYTDRILRSDRTFYAPLTGFTYYRDNLSLYSRTFPGAPTIMAGQDADLSGTPEDFFRRVYPTSPLLHDLKDAGYHLKFYAGNFYSYRSGSVFYGLADNLATYTGYTVTNTGYLTLNMLLLSVYKAVPQLFKPMIDVSTQVFSSFVSYDADSTPVAWNDAEYYQGISEKGLSDGGYENAYTFLHFRGGHDPYVLDRDANEVEKSSATEQVMGDFTIIYKLIDELKKKDLYRDATIIVTGDHPSAISDTKVPTQTRVTGLFVKEAGRSDEPFAVSKAQVSQENLAATIIKSAGVPTAHDYGLAYSEIPEGEDRIRYHQFQLSLDDGDTEILRYKVTGPGTDFDNWELESRTNIGSLYY